MKRILSVMLVAALLVCALPVFSAMAGGPDMVVYNCNEYVSLRQYASTSAPCLVKVPKGATVTNTTNMGTWTWATYGSYSGYILSKYLKAVSSYVSIADQQVYNCTSWVSLRAAADTSAARLAQVPKGATVTNCFSNGTWVYCLYGSQYGYILAKYLKNAATVWTTIADQQVYNCTSWVSLRATASTTAARLAEVPKGAVVTDCQTNGTWVYCKYGSQYGYILAKYLKDYVSPVHPIADQEVYNCTSWVSLRATASTKAAVLDKVPKGAVVTNCITNGTWVQCQYGGQTGYILAKYLKTASTAPIKVLADQKVVNVNEFVNLRATPSTSAPSLTKVPVGAVVTNCTLNGSWVKCTYGAYTGYIPSKYLTDA